MSTKPVFDFKPKGLGLTDDQIADAEKRKGSNSNFMGEGIHSVKIVEADFQIKDGSYMNTIDPTWINIKVKFENAAKAQKLYFLKVPTTCLMFAEGRWKKPELPFVEFKQFCTALGIEVSANAKLLNKVLDKWFSDPTKLIGLTCDIEIGYNRPYVKYLEKDKYQLTLVNGNPIVDEVFPDRKAALVKAALLGKSVQEFPDILSFSNNSAPKVTKTAEVPDYSEEVEEVKSDDKW